MAERVGFVPYDPPPVNDLGRFRSPQFFRTTRNLSIRYKTGTASFGLRRAMRGGERTAEDEGALPMVWCRRVRLIEFGPTASACITALPIPASPFRNGASAKCFAGSTDTARNNLRPAVYNKLISTSVRASPLVSRKEPWRSQWDRQLVVIEIPNGNLITANSCVNGPSYNVFHRWTQGRPATEI